MRLFIEPVDVWLFRDGRPFSAGTDHRATSLFPPYPTALQGAIRSKQLSAQGVDLGQRQQIEAAVGTACDVRKLRIRGPVIARREGNRLVRYYPQPADAYSLDEQAHGLRPASPPVAPPAGLVSNAKLPMLMGMRDKPNKGESGLWLSETDLRCYLKRPSGKIGDLPVVTGVTSAEIFVKEIRPGIGIQEGKNRVTQDGALFEVEFIRPARDIGLYAEIDGYVDWPPNGMLSLGGESRGAHYQLVADSAGGGDSGTELRTDAAPFATEGTALEQHFLLYFATPAYFAGGWRPERGDWSRFFSGKVELKATAVSRYESLGGVDLSKAYRTKGESADIHRPARRYVPAGSVYYFKAEGDVVLATDAVTDSNAHGYEAAIGFGQVIVGSWQPGAL